MVSGLESAERESPSFCVPRAGITRYPCPHYPADVAPLTREKKGASVPCRLHEAGNFRYGNKQGREEKEGDKVVKAIRYS